MVVSGHLHVLSTVFPEKEHPILLEEEAEWVSELV
jgi:hypothetical protein